MAWPWYLKSWWNSDIISLLNFENPLSRSKVIEVCVINGNFMGKKRAIFYPFFVWVFNLEWLLYFGGTTCAPIFFLLFVQKTINLCMDQKNQGGRERHTTFWHQIENLNTIILTPPKNIGCDILKMPSIMKFSYNE